MITDQEPTTPPAMLLAANWWASRGVNVFPLAWPIGHDCSCGKTDCTSPAKHPLTKNGVNDATTDQETITTWWTRWPNANIGVRTGELFDVIDLDGAAAIDAWRAFTETDGTPVHVGLAMSGRDGGGAHLYVVPGGMKTIPSGKRGLPPGVEIKAVGGYVVAPPSRHASGRVYSWVHTFGDGVLLGDVDYPTWYANVTEKTQPAPAPALDDATRILMAGSSETSRDAERAYGDAVVRNACAKIAAAGEGGRWNALALEAIPSVARAIDGGCVDELEGVAALEAAARQAGLSVPEVTRIRGLVADMIRNGITNPIAPPPKREDDPWNGPRTGENRPTSSDDDEDDGEDGSQPWTDLSWILDGDPPEVEPPLILARTDGIHLFYSSRVNGVFGDPDTGKSWLCACAAVECLSRGEAVAWIDIDHNGAPAIVARFLALGADRTSLADPALFRLYEPEDAQDVRVTVLDIIDSVAPALVIVDSIGELIPMLGRSSTDNDDVTTVIRIALTPLARTGAAVVTIDHLPKNPDARTNGFAIGGSAKKRAMDGAYLRAEMIEPLAPGRLGKVRLYIEKDRHGRLKEHSPDGKHAGSFILDSRETTTSWRVEAETVTDATTHMRLTGYMQKVSQYVASYGETAPSMNVIEKAGLGRREYVRRAVATLVDEGYLTTKTGPRGARLVEHVRPYYEASDGLLTPPETGPRPTSPDLARTSPGRSGAPAATSPDSRDTHYVSTRTGDVEARPPGNLKDQRPRPTCTECGEELDESYTRAGWTSHEVCE